MLRFALSSFLVLGVSACGSSFLPTGPRVSMVLQDGSPAFARDGVIVEHGFFGEGLVRVVEGNPQAKEAAESYRDRSTTSFGLLLGGLGTVSVSPFILLGSLASTDQSPNEGVLAASLATALTGLGLVCAGLGVQLSAQPKLYDAINLFNAGVDAREAAMRIPPQPVPAPMLVAPPPLFVAPPPPLAPVAPPEPAPAPEPSPDLQDPFGPRR